MRDDDTRYDQIHSYLAGEMDAQGQADFAQRLATEPDLAEALRLEEELQALIRYQRRVDLKNMLRNIADTDATTDIDATTDPDTPDQQSPPPAPDTTAPPRSDGGGIKPPYWRYAIRFGGIAALLIAAIVIFWPTATQPESLQELASSNDAGASGMIADAGLSDRGTSPMARLWRETDSLFEKGKYDQAYRQLDSTSTNDSILFLRAAALRGDSLNDRAYPILQQAANIEGSKFSGIALWNLAIIDLYRDDRDAAVKHLDQLISFGSLKPKEAKEILAKIAPKDD
jgi:hypothetical protein